LRSAAIDAAASNRNRVNVFMMPPGEVDRVIGVDTLQHAVRGKRGTNYLDLV
jgi:hypothetical protein